ncbi:helix-turn-helix domain-containing protein [Natronobacterium gregoryi]|uniref:Bacterio-opsin activator n=2 Tax=Natronobacterium gregoryi TaxID=44930 RepID=L0AKJ2_NATGS|nr:helix-turn-helix domain-containing protein [Natronobacterium gregoryi]AFZ73677.1 putative DNA binding protein [Natronobacterium gregoryi SP2]ELY67869.1 Bacterio-opsin activator HTH domain protein [Natronobacterium gregoryi SP2]PLK19598.1 bacterio-opsin activator [Natronobacterium gregoryi SP2]SFJ00849.1 HTH DNA binding domain-containing protein [Natronobacterium gregoryi]
MSVRKEDRSTKESDGQRKLRAEIGITTGDCRCPLEKIDSSSLISHKILNDTCHILVSEEPGESCPKQVETQLSSHCLCTAFIDHNCVPIPETAHDDYVVISTYLSDRSVLKSVISDLREIADDVSLKRLSTPGDSATSDLRSVDLSLLTRCEQHTLTVAIESGYYCSPRKISFDELSSELEVSKSTLSQRLSAAESKLLLDLLEH